MLSFSPLELQKEAFMTHSTRNEKAWQAFSVEEKLDALHEDITKLFSIAEESSHKNHMLMDAIQLVHSRLDEQSKAIHNIQNHANHQELMS